MGPLAILCHPHSHPPCWQGRSLLRLRGMGFGQTSGELQLPRIPRSEPQGSQGNGEACVKPRQISAVSACCRAAAPGPEGRAGGPRLSRSPAKLARSTPGCAGTAPALPFIWAVAALAFHLPKAGGAAPPPVKSIPFSPSSPSPLFRKWEWRRERQVCKQLSQLPSAQAPVLLACKLILEQYIQSILVKAFLSLALQPLSKGGSESLSFP